ncbi:MAG: Thiamine biosynthesis lipoprotein ApbE precursor [Spirochaetes bacterium ADurb.Bin110]|nr:MAG: Thiamine biosynthesis lipoprotein ApbE precursor [Spirochaetes bacterium ADurb.Bin110]
MKASKIKSSKFFSWHFIVIGFVLACAIGARLSRLCAKELSKTDFALGTLCTIRLLEGGNSATLAEAFARLRTIEDRMSVNKEGTEVSKINKMSGKEAVQVSSDTFYVISKAIEYAKLTNGAFDPSIGPLVKLWNIGESGEKVPSSKDILAAKALVDWQDVVLDASTNKVFLRKQGMRLDLGAIAKGYAADEVEKILQLARVKAAAIDLGGNVLVYGTKKDKTSWRVGIQNPESERGDYLGIVEGPQMTVVTSGVYERYFIENGKWYHHIMDTKTGFPVDNGLMSVSIVSKSSIDADALSTSLFALGIEQGMELLKRFPDAYAIFIDKEKKVYLSPGAEKVFTLIDKSYTLVR